MAIIRKTKKVKRLDCEVGEKLDTARSVLELAARHDLGTSPVDLKSVTKLLGIRLKIKSIADDVSGYLSKEDNEWTIVINSLHHPKRQRFTLAHELGHFFLHSGTQETFIDKKLFRNGDSNQMETEANRFAAELLMPEQDFRHFISDTSSRVEDLADRFEVSALAVRVRAKQLGYTGHGLS